MKVLLAHNYYRSSAPSGEDGVFRNECALLRAKDVDVVLYERFNDNIDESTLLKRGAIGLATAWSKQSYAEISQLVRETRPDVAHFHNTFPLISPSAYAACRNNGVPVVQTLHNYRLICPGGLLMRDGHPCEDCVGTSLMPALRHRCYRDSLPATGAVVWMLARNRWKQSYGRLVTRFIALSRFAADRLIAGGLPRERLRTKPNFLPIEPSVGKATGAPYAVYVGRLTEEKGVRTLLKAWRHLREFPLKVIGDGLLRNELETYSKQHAIEVEFMGYRDKHDVLSTVRGASLQVVPSECYENFPLVILEAYACAKPIVASDIGSLPEIVEHGKTGLLFEPRNPEDLAAKVKTLAYSPDLGEWGKRALAVFEAEYTADRNYQQLMEIYSEAIRA